MLASFIVFIICLAVASLMFKEDNNDAAMEIMGTIVIFFGIFVLGIGVFQ